MAFRPDSRFRLPAMLLDWYLRSATGPGDAYVGPDARISYRELLERIRPTVPAAEIPPRTLLSGHPGSAAWTVDLLAGLAAGHQVVVPDQDWPPERVNAHVAPVLSGDVALPEVLRRSPGIWLFTSGTTSRPKPRFRPLALLQDNVARVTATLPEDFRSQPPHALSILPMSHGFGLLNSLLVVHALGGTIVRVDPANPASIRAALATHPIDLIYGWPSHFELLAEPGLWAHAARPPRWCVSSAVAMPADLPPRFAAAAGCPVRQQYGSTETGPLCTDLDTPPNADPRCVGTPLPGVELRIAPFPGNPADGSGEIQVRLPHLGLSPDELTPDGFYPTGDRGTLGPGGRVFVLARLRPFTDERADAT
jgi:acyl-coenzyme A synthetase/AMP-(fatty) acid ligase